MGGKQADRAAKKKTAKEEETNDAAPVQTGSFPDMLKMLFLGSTIMKVVPQLQGIVTDDSKAKAPAKDDDKKEEEDENTPLLGGKDEKDAPVDESSIEYADSCFAFLKQRIGVFHNCLGLATPSSEEESLAGWMELKSLELDWGPRPKRNQSPGMDRIKANMFNNAPQYLHILLALMMLRAFLFRSWFACLPWLVGYQYLSFFIPLDGFPQLPQVPIEKCPLKFRVAASAGIHLLVWLFFVYEVLWGMWFFEKGFVIGLFCYHGYAVRPADKAKGQ